ncbi:hypothetical protein [Trujillonella humicola]|uniref:hypothetical protein n=1 Tax=Trujillonella humicola TaxID=3383699 RepID=UPI003905976B
MTFEPVPAVGDDARGAQDIVAGIDTWTASEPLRALVAGFGGPADLFAGSLGDRLTALDGFSTRWDGRRGAERNLATPLELTDEQVALTDDAARALGLVDPRPPRRKEYDHVFALGGLVRACVVRPAHVARLIATGDVRTADVTALGGHRPFGGDEGDLARAVGLDGVDEEYEALDAGTRRAFGLGAPVAEDGERSDLPGGTWSVRTYEGAGGLRIRVAAAPSSEPERRRAHTADTYDWFARTLAAVEPGQTLLAVTTAIYVPAQQAAALRMLALPFDVQVETVGVVPGSVLPELAQTFTPSHHLQEIRSAIRGYRALHTAALEHAA